MRENEHFWLGVTLSDEPAPADLFVVASHADRKGSSFGD